MAEDSVRWNLSPAWRLSIAILVGLALTVMAMVWPAIVDGSRPDVGWDLATTDHSGPGQ